MRIILCALFLLVSNAFAQPEGFVNPLHFDYTDFQKEKVIAYIQQGSFNKYCEEMGSACHPNILQLAQTDNLMAFLELSDISNKDYLNQLIEEHCNSERFQCSYDNLLNVYKERLWCDVGIWEMRAEYNSSFNHREYPTIN